MENGPDTVTASALGKQEAISAVSTSLPGSESTGAGESTNSSAATTATTPTDSPVILKSAALEALRSKAGLVAGALSDFQAAKGLVAVTQTPYKQDGKTYQAVKVILLLDGNSLVVVHTPDGLDFDVRPGE